MQQHKGFDGVSGHQVSFHGSVPASWLLVGHFTSPAKSQKVMQSILTLIMEPGLRDS
jgi:hypothetical protein